MPSTQDIEARFKKLSEKIDRKIENEEFDSDFDDLVSQLENEFMQIDEYCNSTDKEADRLFVAHNFWIRYAIWKASKSDTSFIDSYSTALILLLKRCLIKPYNFESLKRQLWAFTKYWIFIEKSPKTDKRNVHVDIKTLLKNNDSLKELGEVLKNNDDLKESLSTTKLDDILYGLLRYQIYYALKTS